jgi:hypothetical protein
MGQSSIKSKEIMGRTKDIYIQQLQADMERGIYDREIQQRKVSSNETEFNKDKIKSNAERTIRQVRHKSM